MLENVLGAGVTNPDSPRLKTQTRRDCTEMMGGKQEALSTIQRSGFLRR
jgi:hypothetical protein